MIDFDRIVAELELDNTNAYHGRLIHVAEVLLTWWRASIDVRCNGAVKDGKPNPSVKVSKDAAALLWGKTMTGVTKEGAIKYLEEETRNEITQRTSEGQTEREPAVSDDVDPADLPGRGVSTAAVDRGSPVVVRDLGGHPDPRRKRGRSKIPARLRAGTLGGTD